jgi:PAS domain S-box-containing protein
MANQNFIRNLSIKNKITVIILFVAFTVITIGFIFISFWDSKRLKTETESQLSLNATLIGDYCVVPLYFGDRQQASVALSRLKFIESVEEGYLIDGSGAMFASYPDSIKNQVVGSISENINTVFKENHFYIREPVRFEDQIIGTLFIKANSNQLVRQNQKLIVILLFAFLSMLIISFLLAFRLQKLITTPILKLAELTAGISETQDYSVQLEVYAKDEVGILYQQFNNFLSQIFKRQKERDAAEKEIAFLAQVLKSINEFVSITDLEDNIIFVNQAWVKMFGYTEEEAIGKKISLIVSPDNSPELVAEILPVTLKGGWQGEVINRKKDGTEFPVMLFTTIIYNNSNQPIALVGISSDITERKKFEEELIKHRDHLEQMVHERTDELRSLMDEMNDLYENAPCGYHSLNERGTFVRINNTELQWLGYKREELINKMTGSDVMTPESKELFKKAFSEFLKKGDINNAEFEYVRKDGTTFFGSLNATSIHDKNGKFLMTRSTLFDITERKQIEVALSKAIEEAENANKAKSEFLANMSHEIRTPMNAVLGYTELLSSLLTEETQKNYIESIKSSGRSLLTLINDILDLSKIEAGKLELEYDFVDSNFFFTEFERIFALKAAENGIKFIVDIQSGTPAGIYIDEPRLRQIIFNLIGNAIKFTKQGHVLLKVYTENLKVVAYSKEKSEEFLDLIIEVEDTGIGISKEIMEEIFDPFIQARDQKNIGGTGLGLAITRRLTLLMNGTINLKSKLGEGSTFTVKIPEIAFRKEFISSKLTVNVNPEDVLFEPATILVVDDVEHNRNFIRDTLKNTKITVLQADEGFKALELAKDVIPDLIISDIRMPNMDGFELLKRLKANNKLKDIPVLAYSASVLKDQKEKIHQSQFVGLLTKPVNITELYLELMNHLAYNEVHKEKSDQTLIDDSKAEIVNLKELIKSLESDLKETWMSFEIRQPIGEIKKFGEDLIRLGTEHNSSLIIQYGKELRGAADSFDIEAILMLLKRYISNIEKLKNIL